MADGYLNFDTNVNTKGFNGGVKNIGGSLEGVRSKLKNVAVAAAAAFSVKKIIDFGKTAVTAASETSNAWQGLESILNGQGRSYGQATKWIQKYVSDGLVPLSNAVTAYKNLAARGYDDTQIQNVLTALKDSAAFGRQASYSLGDAVTSATEGLKNENSILVDNAGVTKNVAKMWDDYAKSIGTTSNNLTQQQKIQAEVNGILTETRFQAGDAAKVANTFSGRLSQLAFSFNQLKVALGNILTAVLKPLLEHLNLALQKITGLLNAAAKALGIANNAASSASSLAGNTTDLADTSSDAADNYDDMATAAKKAQKANEKSLMSFDKINKLNDNKSSDDGSDSSKTTAVPNTLGGTTTFKVNADTKGAKKQFTKFFKRIKKGFGSLLDPFKKAWANKGKAVLDSMHYKWQSIGELVKAVGESFKTVWTNGTGQKIIEHLLDIWTNINTTIGNIARQLKKAWTADNLGTEIVQHAADIFVTILKHINRITKKIFDWAGGLDFKPLLKSFDTLLKALEPFADTVGEGLEWFCNNVLLPLGKWTIEKVIPTFLSTLADVIKGVTAVLKTAMPVLKDKFWDGFLKPIAKWAGDKALKALSGLGSVIKKIGKSITKEQVSVLATLAEVIGTIVLACKGKKFIDRFVNSLSGLGTQAAQKLSGAFKGWDKSITATAEEGGTSFATKFAASAGAFFVGWEIGTYLHEAMGGEEFDEKFLYPIFDKIVGLKNRWIKTFENLGAKLADIAFNCTAKIKGLVKSWTTFFEGVGGKIYNVVSGAVTRAKNVVNSWNKFFGNIGSKAYDIVSSCVAKIKNTVNSWYKFFAGIGGKVYDVVSNAAKKIKNVVTSWTKFFEGIGSKICDIMSDSVSGIKKAWSGVKGFFSGIWGGIKGVFSSVGSWFKNIFSKAWGGIKSVFSSVGSFFSGLWEKIKKPFAKVADWFKDKFSKAWQAVKDVFSKGGKVFSGIKDGILNGLKTVINGLIKGINKVVSIPFKGLNKAFEKLKGVKILNKKPFDFLPEIDIPQIPQLATGTVVPANYGEFMAILGDNKREAEVVSPLSTIKQAVMEAAVELGLIGGKQNGGNMTVNLVCDGKTLASVVIDDINDRTKRNGRSPLNA